MPTLKTIRTRDEVVKECVNVAVACWQHYSDIPLNLSDIHALNESLSLLLPHNIFTTEWSRYAEEKQKEYDAEEEEKGLTHACI